MANLCYSNYALPIDRYGIMVNEEGNAMVTARNGRANKDNQHYRVTSFPLKGDNLVVYSFVETCR